MRKSLLLITGIVLLLHIAARGQEGMDFRELGFQQALETAKKEGKLVFIDCYTSWCGPCRYMAKNVFVQKKLGDYFNSRFVCVKYDMEKGEGPELAEKFRVKAYPTFLVIDTDGSLRHKWLGAMGGDDFIARAEASFDENKAVGIMERRYEKGEIDKAFLSSYARVLDECEDARLPDVINELMKVLSDEDKFSDEYRYIFEVVNKSPIGSLARDFFIEKREKFAEIMGEAEVNRNIFFAYMVDLQDVFKGNKKLSTEEVEQRSRDIEKLKLGDDFNKILQPYLEIAKAMATGKVDNVIKTCEKVFLELPQGHIPKELFTLYANEASEKQKARWEKLLEQLP